MLPALIVVALAASLLAAEGHAAAPRPTPGAALVVSPQRDASRVGAAVLADGGNAIDAAVATAFALAVTQPQSTGIGGGAFLLVRLADGRAFALDARETAPAATHARTYLDASLPERASLFGGLAVATPGFVPGMAVALERWGTQSLARLIEPARRLAADGYTLEPYQERWIDRLAASPLPQRFPETARIQLVPPGPRGRRRLVQADLAHTLGRIARDGPDVMRRGPLAEAIARAARDAGGVLSADDLAAYTPVVREPVRGSYRGTELLSFPPPSSGGVALVQTLNVLEGFDLSALGAGSSAAIHRVAEAMKLAFADRAVWLGDPDFRPVPVDRLTSKVYASELRARLAPPWWRRAPWRWGRGERALRVDGPGPVPDDQGTAHLSVIDAAGNAVAITSTINGPYGSWVTVPGTGILLNNEMDDFVTDPDAPNLYGLVGIGDTNHVAPGKRPLSSMSPTIVTRDGKVALVSGSNGGPRIISSTLLSILNVVDFGMDAAEAVSAPRFHHQWRPDRLVIEGDHPADVVAALEGRGHHVESVDEIVTGVQLIVCRAGAVATLPCEGASDPRRDGRAISARID